VIIIEDQKNNMPIHNTDIVENFNKVADLLEIKGVNPFRFRAYRIDNPVFNILAHPSGRLINARAPYEFDLERLIEAAAERGCFMELNAHPDRLDLNDVFCKTAKDLGVKVAVSTDAHCVDGLDHMRLGIHHARRGWLEADDVLNPRSWEELKKICREPEKPRDER
jgi:histidinol phosphatase-like PHP family hydrolase